MDDRLTLADLRPRGGTWSGILFDDPSAWRAPSFTWSFSVQYGEATRSRGSSPVALILDLVPLKARHWQDMVGQKAASPTFAHPIEASVYFFEHHRYDTTKLLVVEQRRRSLHIVAEVRGDLDGLGVDSIPVDAWLLFDGLAVALSDPPPTVEAARACLETFTDTTGLEGFERFDEFWFTPTEL